MSIPPIVDLESHSRLVVTLAFSRDGKRLASGAQDCRAIVQNVDAEAGGAQPRIFRHLGGAIRVAAFDAQERRLLTEGRNGKACVFALDGAAPPLEYSAFHEDSEARVEWAAWSPSGDEIAAMVSNGGIYVFSARAPEKYHVLWGDGCGERVLYSPSGEQVLGIYREGPILFQQHGENPRRLGPRKATEECTGAVFDPSGAHIAVAYNGRVSLHSASEARPELSLDPHEGYVTALHFSADGRFLMSAARDGTVRFFDVPSGQPRGILRHDCAVHEARLSADRKWLGTLTENGALWLWQLDDPAQPPRARFVLAQLDDSITALDFSPTQPRLAIGWDFGRVQCLSLNPTELAALPAHWEAQRQAAKQAGAQPFTTPLSWRRTDDSEFPYETRVGRALWNIGVSAYSDEPTSYTLYPDRDEAQDFAQWPACWKRSSD